jgi:hypothetical protein
LASRPQVALLLKKGVLSHASRRRFLPSANAAQSSANKAEPL